MPDILHCCSRNLSFLAILSTIAILKNQLSCMMVQAKGSKQEELDFCGRNGWIVNMEATVLIPALLKA